MSGAIRVGGFVLVAAALVSMRAEGGQRAKRERGGPGDETPKYPHKTLQGPQALYGEVEAILTLGATKKDVPHRIETNLVVPEGAGITFREGSRVILLPPAGGKTVSVRLDGWLILKGTPKHPVIFEAYPRAEAKVECNSQGRIIAEYCVLKEVSISAPGGTLQLTNCYLENSPLRADGYFGGLVTLKNSRLSNCKDEPAITLERHDKGPKTRIESCVITGNKQGIMVKATALAATGRAPLHVENCNIFDNAEANFIYQDSGELSLGTCFWGTKTLEQAQATWRRLDPQNTTCGEIKVLRLKEAEIPHLGPDFDDPTAPKKVITPTVGQGEKETGKDEPILE